MRESRALKKIEIVKNMEEYKMKQKAIIEEKKEYCCNEYKIKYRI